MTLTNNQSTVTYQGDGETVTWPFTFEMPTTSACHVSLWDGSAESRVSASDFTLTGVGLEDGGQVTYPLSGDAITAGTFITITRDGSLTQDYAIKNAGAFYPDAIERSLDTLTEEYQALAVRTSRAALAASGFNAPTGIPTQDMWAENLTATTLSVSTITVTAGTIRNLFGTGPVFETSANPSSVTSGATVTLSGATSFTPLSMTQSAAALTVYLPSAPTNGQIAGFSIDQTVTVLTVTTSSGVVANPPSVTISQMAGGSYGWIYSDIYSTWFRTIRSSNATVNLQFLTASASFNFPSTNNPQSSILTATVTGSVVGDFVRVSPLTDVYVGGFLTGLITSDGVVSVMYCNMTNTVQNPVTGSVNILVLPKSQFGL